MEEHIHSKQTYPLWLLLPLRICAKIETIDQPDGFR